MNKSSGVDLIDAHQQCLHLQQGEADSSVYVLLSKDHRVSRSFRATWHLRNLLTAQVRSSQPH